MSPLILECLWMGTLFGSGVVNAMTAPRAEKTRPPKRYPLVSLLIPARNEAKNLHAHLPAWLGQDYPNLEVLVIDDHSEDETWKVLQEFSNSRWVAKPGINPKDKATTSSQFKAMRGQALPEGWLGKNWACAQLAECAQGKILIFCDADARPETEAVTRTVSLLEKYRVGTASLIPRQILGTHAEKAVIPLLLHASCLVGLPLRCIPWLRWPALGVANGQWLAFTRPAYQAIGGHTAVRDHVVEDLALARLSQERGHGLVLALGAKTLTVRMYHDFRGVWEGFGKNLFILAGDNPLRWVLLLALFLATYATPLVWLALGLAQWVLIPESGIGILNDPTVMTGKTLLPILPFLPFLFLVGIRVLTWRLMREPLSGWLWHVWGVLLIPILAAQSVWKRRHGRLTWKGRILDSATISPKESLV